MASATYQVQVKRYNIPAITVVFIRDDAGTLDQVVTDGAPLWANLTLTKGPYTVKVYEAATGLFRKQFDVYVARTFRSLFKVSRCGSARVACASRGGRQSYVIRTC